MNPVHQIVEVFTDLQIPVKRHNQRVANVRKSDPVDSVAAWPALMCRPCSAVTSDRPTAGAGEQIEEEAGLTVMLAGDWVENKVQCGRTFLLLV